MPLLTRALALAALIAAAPALAQNAAPVGVPECDQFLQRYDACLAANVPEAQRDGLRASINQMRAAWRQAAQNAQARAGLGPQCTQIGQQMAQSLAQYKCQF